MVASQREKGERETAADEIQSHSFYSHQTFDCLGRSKYLLYAIPMWRLSKSVVSFGSFPHGF